MGNVRRIPETFVYIIVISRLREGLPSEWRRNPYPDFVPILATGFIELESCPHYCGVLQLKTGASRKRSGIKESRFSWGGSIYNAREFFAANLT
jgi:hypothetical protein